MKYLLKNLDCANCAAKIENSVKKIKGVDSATVNFMTQKLIIEATNLDEVMVEVAKIVNKIDKNIIIK